MSISVLNANAKMPDLLGEDGFIRLLPSAAYDDFDPEGLRLWCHKHARYGLPTIELISWLREKINGRKAIEIGAGAGDLSHYLNIPGTDNRMQEWPYIEAIYSSIGQPVIKYPVSVRGCDALTAIEVLSPDVVVASWVTEWIDPNKEAPASGGNIYGVKEDQIIASGVTYIVIGNTFIHGAKKIMQESHQTFDLPFVRSRASHPKENRIWVWN